MENGMSWGGPRTLLCFEFESIASVYISVDIG